MSDLPTPLPESCLSQMGPLLVIILLVSGPPLGDGCHYSCEVWMALQWGWFSQGSRGDLAPQGIFGNVWRHLHNLGVALEFATGI